MHNQLSQSHSHSNHYHPNLYSQRSSSSSTTLLPNQLPPIDYLSDFINAIYQGYLPINCSQQKPQGLGIVIDDDFTFVLCDNWKNGKINGLTLIKFINQITVWGVWGNNIPLGVMGIQLKQLLIFLPYRYIQMVPSKRVTRCILYNKIRHKIYIAAIDRKQVKQSNKKTNRQYNIVIQKIEKCKSETKLKQICQTTFQYELQEYMYSPQQFICNLQANQKISCSMNLGFPQIVNFKKKNNKNIFISINQKSLTINSPNTNQHHPQNQIITNYQLYTQPLQTYATKYPIIKHKLGLVVNWDNMNTISVGTYSIQHSQSNPNLINSYKLNGIGLSKTISDDSIIGTYKNDMIIKQITYRQLYIINSGKQDIQNSVNHLKASSVIRQIKQRLSHQHMKSLSYIHDYLLFPQFNRICKVIIQLCQYVGIFQKLAANHKVTQISSSESESRTNNPIPQTHHSYGHNQQQNSQMQHYDSNKYKNMRIKIVENQDSQIYKQLYQQSHRKTALNYIDKFSENYNNLNKSPQPSRQKSQTSKKPGFITKKSPIAFKHIDNRSSSPIYSNKKYDNNYRRNGSIGQPKPRRKILQNNFIRNSSRSKTPSQTKQQKRWKL